MTKFGSKISAFALIGASATLLSACGGFSLPTCNDELNECDRGGAYTEERTVQANKRKAYVQPAPAPAPAPVAAAPAPAPAPVPAPVQDTQVMRSAEPQFTQITK